MRVAVVLVACFCYVKPPMYVLGFGPGDLRSEVVQKHVLTHVLPHIPTASLQVGRYKGRCTGLCVGRCMTLLTQDGTKKLSYRPGHRDAGVSVAWACWRYYCAIVWYASYTE